MAVTAYSLTGTARIPPWRFGAPARHSAWTPTWCLPGTNTAVVVLCSTKSTGPQPRCAVVCLRPDANTATGLVQKPVTKVEDFKGPEVPHGRSLHRHFHCAWRSRESLPGGEIVAAMDRGLLDAAEFNNTSSDKVLGFRMYRRSACCSPSIKAASSSRSCSTRPNTTHCRPI